MADSDHHHLHHDHSQQHLHGHKDNEAFTEANRAHWNDFASQYSSQQWQRDLLNSVNAFIQQHINWIGVDFIDPSSTFESPLSQDTSRRVRVLDYACGPGTITHALGSRATEYIGMDLSENMVKAYNLRFNPEPSTHAITDTSGIYDRADEALNAHAAVANLIDAKDPSPETVSSPEYSDFDLVVVGLGFHHFQDIPLATSRLVQRLRKGGVFLILDFVTHAMDEKSPSGKGELPAKHTVAHAGFSEDELKRCFEGAGLAEFKIVKMDGEVLLRGETKRRPFLARGTKL